MDEKMTGQSWFDVVFGLLILVLGWFSNKQYERITDLEKDMDEVRSDAKDTAAELTQKFLDKFEESRRERVDQIEGVRKELRDEILEHARASTTNFGIVNGKLDALMLAMVKKYGE